MNQSNKLIELKNIFLLIAVLFSTISYSQTQSKKELLQSLVGTYALNVIEGTSGMNATTNYDKKLGKWTGIYSMRMFGKREYENIKITPDLLNKLNTMSVIVNPDLSVDFMCKGINIVSIPFKEDGMIYEITGAKEDSWKKINKDSLSSKTCFGITTSNFL